MQTYTRHAVIGYFSDEAAARAAFEELLVEGFSREQVHVSSSNEYLGTNIPAGASQEDFDSRNGGTLTNGRNTRAETQGGGIRGWFHSIFGSDKYDNDARRYSDRARAGGSVVAVETTDETRTRAIDVLNSHGASDVDEEREDFGASAVKAGERSASFNEQGRDFIASGEEINERGADFNARGADFEAMPSQSTSGPPIPTASPASRAEERTVPVIREELEVGKRPIVSGGVRVYTRMVEEPVEEQVRLRQERVVVDRQPANRAAPAADQGSLREQTIDVMAMSEEPVIQKRSRVVEEVRVGKEATERTETVRETLRHTEVVTEPIPVDAANGSPSREIDNYHTDFENDFKRRYATAGGDFAAYAPAYEYGYKMGGDPRFKGRIWNEVEPTIRTDFGQRYPDSAWERVKDAVRYGWDKITGE